MESDSAAWKEVPEYPAYEAHPLGLIRRKENGKVKKPTLNSLTGTQSVCLSNQEGVSSAKLVHRVIAQTFLPPPSHSKMVITHINCDKSDNQVTNLQWISWSDQNRKRRYFREMKGVPIVQMNESGVVLRTFVSVQAAANWVQINIYPHKKKSPRGLRNTIFKNLGKGKLYVGYQWLRERDLPSNEVWQPVPAHACLGIGSKDLEYSDRGNIRNHLRRILGSEDISKSHRVSFTSENGSKHFKIDSIIAASVYGPIPDGKVILHLDGDVSNNRPSNLKICSREERQDYLISLGVRSPSRSIPVKAIDASGNEWKFSGSFEAAKWLGGPEHQSCVRLASKNGRLYKDLTWIRDQETKI